jgi:hypothetical protein
MKEKPMLTEGQDIKRQTVIHLMDEAFSGVMNTVVPPAALADIPVLQSN